MFKRLADVSDSLVQWIETGEMTFKSTFISFVQYYVIVQGVLVLVGVALFGLFGEVQSYEGREQLKDLTEGVGTAGISTDGAVAIGAYYLVAAVVEEVVFRYLAVGLFALILWKRFPKAVLVIALVSSLMFGFAHAPAYALGIGGGGMVLSILFLRVWRARQSFLLALASTTAIHFGWNAFTFIGSTLTIVLGLR